METLGTKMITISTFFEGNAEIRKDTIKTMNAIFVVSRQTAK